MEEEEKQAMNSSEQSIGDHAINIDPREQPRKDRSPWFFWPGVSLLILVLIFGGLATASTLLTHQIAVSRTVAVGSAPRLILISQSGAVHLVSGPAGQIRVVMRERVLLGNNDVVPAHFSLSPDGNTLTITADHGPGFSIGFSESEFDFDIAAPSQTALDIHTESGDITSQGINGEMNLSSSSGDITTDGGSNQITLSSSSGDITASNISGHMILSCSSGDVTATNASAYGNSTFQTDSGDITYSGTLVQSTSSLFHTSSGDINLTLPETAAFKVLASTESGSINSDFTGVNVLQSNGSGAEAAGTVGQPPYVQISIQVSSGDIHLRTAA